MYKIGPQESIVRHPKICKLILRNKTC